MLDKVLEKSRVVLKPIIVFLTGFLPHDFAAVGLRAKLNTTHMRPSNESSNTSSVAFPSLLSFPRVGYTSLLLNWREAGPVGFVPTGTTGSALEGTTPRSYGIFGRASETRGSLPLTNPFHFPLYGLFLQCRRLLSKIIRKMTGKHRLFQ